ncbi:MAG: hypothetical protein A3G60_01860 [Candidatus Ryanbacteria bacterium RIFCSPLOWO2_12_FULL_47_9c]|uniref:DUF922 domain-containing protein n=1 Tax=Candidatus Ryanbacteria bacterium RIFCSPLOWO2_12_FULL_47_9c TaxID=1802131 RepID=A0A1G2H191_9BACT|nr:MAG: hypothetical protein A3G60_01860 [Candidatus Ryanbacteria bacterium RIFCSPLOWO2_12_FULL_47_9c]
MKKIIIGFILLPLIIFATGVMFVLVGGGLNSMFKKDSGVSTAENKTQPQTEKTDVPSAQAPNITQVTKPAISYAITYYDVSGLTKDEIKANMTQARKGTFLEGHNGATTAEININFKRRQLADKCETVMDKFDLSLIYTYPRLTSLPSVSSGIAAAWNTFIAALKVHEEGHAKIEVERANILFQKLLSLPEYKTCEEFDQTYDVATNTHEEETKLIGAQYDKDTQGGRLQGISF